MGIARSAVYFQGVVKITSSIASFRRNLLVDGVQILYGVVSVNTSPEIVLSKMSESHAILTALLQTNGYANAVSLRTTEVPQPTTAPTQTEIERGTALPAGSVAAAVILSVFAAAVIIAVIIFFICRRKKLNATFANIEDGSEQSPKAELYKEACCPKSVLDLKHTL